MNSAVVKTKAIITPRIDAICGGGLSLLVALFVIGYGWFRSPDGMLIAIELYLLTDLLINSPHFMASYRLLYSNPKNFHQHPMVTVGFPILAFIFIGYVTYWCFKDPASTESQQLGIVILLNWIAPIFLGWHYMGQSWGMTACYSFLSGFRMTPTERRLIRSGFHALFLYHVVWAYDSMGFVQGILAEEEAGIYLMQSIMSLCRLSAFVGFAAGLWGFRQMSLREGAAIPLRVWLPWLATFSWYVMVDVHPASFFLLQVFHAIQYMSFPIRVEINEFTRPRHRVSHMIAYYTALVVLGYIAFEWSTVFGGVENSRLQIATATMMAINIHHYFTDAVIWKIRDPEVRHALFGHLEPAQAKPAAA